MVGDSNPFQKEEMGDFLRDLRARAGLDRQANLETLCVNNSDLHLRLKTRRVRWQRIQEYDFEIQHRQGHEA